MARNSSGTHSLPASTNPVVSGTTITPTWANGTLSDLSTEITDSLSRSGKGGMTAPLRCADGTVGAPAHSYTSETSSGWFRDTAGVLKLAILGVYRLSVAAAGAVVNGTLNVVGAVTHQSTTSLAGNVTFTAGSSVITTQSNSGVTIKGNRDASDSGAEVVVNSTATRLAGPLVDIQNNGTSKFVLDFNGEPSLQGGLACGFVAKTDADQTDAVGTLTTITGFSFPVSANAGYVWELIYDGTGTGTSSSGRVAFTGPASPTRVRYQVGSGTIATSFTTQLAAGGTASESISVIQGLLQNGANAGTVTAQFLWNSSGTSATVHKGSYLRWRRIY